MTSNVDISNQSLVLPGEERIHVNALFPDYSTIECGDISTVCDIFQKGVQISGDNDFLGWRASYSSDYQWISYNKVNERAYHVGCGLKELGYGKGTLVGFYARNNPELVIAEVGYHMFSMTTVTIYDTSGKENMESILKETEMEVMFCDGDKVQNVMEMSKESVFLKHIVIFGELSDQRARKTCEERNIKLITFQGVEKLGKDNPHDKELPDKEDTALICYTSGTTGNPKGVVLTHQAIVACICGFQRYQVKDGVNIRSEMIGISYLPMSHTMERAVQYYLIINGARIGFFLGDVKKLANDIKALRPHIMAVVPRILNSLYNKIQGSLAESSVKSMLFNFASKMKFSDVKRGIISKDTLWDWLVFRSVQEILGGRLELMVCGSAPISCEVLSFFKTVLGCKVYEGYGQTETVAPATLSSCKDYNTGHVGPPIPGCQIKLIDVPEMDYYSSKDEGEVCIRSLGTMKKYFKQPEKTKETLDDEGWIHTGDIGKWLPNGTLKIIDRKKQLFKLCQGEYIAPEKLENVYGRSLFVGQCFVTGNSLQRYIVAIVVPNEEQLLAWAKKQGISGTYEELCQTKDARDAIQKSMESLGDKAGLSSLEKVKAIYLHPIPMSPENGLLTPTMKVRRSVAAKHFQTEIDDLYRKLNAKFTTQSSIF